MSKPETSENLQIKAANFFYGLAGTAHFVFSLLIKILLFVWKNSFSLILGPRCRFCPSCSDYAAQAVIEHGIILGSWLSLRRLLKCHPWSKGGIDLVPPRKTERKNP